MPTVASPGLGSSGGGGGSGSVPPAHAVPTFPRPPATLPPPVASSSSSTAVGAVNASPLHQKIHLLEESLKRFKIFDRNPPPPPPLRPPPTLLGANNGPAGFGGPLVPSVPSSSVKVVTPRALPPPMSLGELGPLPPKAPSVGAGGGGNSGSTSSCSSTTSSGCRTSPMPRRNMILDVSQSVGVNSATRRYIPRRRPHEWHNGLVASVDPPSKRYSDSAEVQRRLEEIMQLTGILRIDGKQYKAEPSDMIMVGELGHGTCGQVVKMKFKQTGTLMAVKQMRRSGNKEENKRVIMDLDVVLKSHDCPYIVKCFGCFITDCDVWVCMELMATCLEKLAKRIKAPIPEQILGKMAVSLLMALDYLKEKQGIIHRDVKPSNMLLDWDGTIKLCDFGISGRLVDSKAKTKTGCAAYMSPERIDPPDPRSPDYDIRADVWSLGISLVELARGSFPYEGCSTDFEVLARILGDEPPCLPLEGRFSDEFRHFITCCLVKDHIRRPKYKQLIAHPFIQRYERTDVDVSGWFQKAMAAASPSPSPDANSNFPPPPLPPKPPAHRPSPSP